jgi:predicted ATPase
MLAQSLPDIERELPESVRGMIERKVAQLGEEDRKLLTAASVQGYEFDSAAVAQVLNLDADEVEERLEKLERVFAFVKLVSEAEFPNRTLTLKYRFVHVLYQNALYATLRMTRKVALSREVAQTLEEFYGAKKTDMASELATLFEAGREFAKAADYFLRAAEHANQLFAPQEAAALARRGIDTLKSLPESPERAQQEIGLQLSLGLSLRTLKGFGAAETSSAYARARELCQQVGDSPQIFPVLFGLWESYQNQAQFEMGMELAKQMLHAAGEDPALQVVAHNAMGDNLTWLGDFITAREHLERGIALYDFDQHRANALLYGYDSGVGCLGFGAIVLWHLGYTEQARTLSDKACEIAAQLSHPASTAYATSFTAWFHRLNGSMQTAQEYAERTITDSVKYDMTIFLAFGEIALGWTYIGQGKVEGGLALARKGGERWRAAGALLGAVWNAGILAEGYGKAGRTAEALALLNDALELAAQTNERFYEAELWRLKGEALLQSEAESSSEAESCFQQAGAIARQQSAKSLELRATMSLARLWRHLGKHKEAYAMLAEIYGWFTEGFDTADLKDAKALLDELQQSKE